VRGGKAICEHLENRLGIHAGETTADGNFTLLKAECLAACGQAPVVDEVKTAAIRGRGGAGFPMPA
jgi:NADH:ubiquinone oxidoreductase subunit E